MTEDLRRQQIIDIIKREFIGPDPVNYEGFIQPDGEEIINFEPPRLRYSAGILFPQEVTETDLLAQAGEIYERLGVDDDGSSTEEFVKTVNTVSERSGSKDLNIENEDLVNLSNAFQQSAISMTVYINKNSRMSVEVSAGTYTRITSKNPQTNKTETKFAREPLKWSFEIMDEEWPEKRGEHSEFKVWRNNKETGLVFVVTYRYAPEEKENIIYTFTLLNSKYSGNSSPKDEDCFFQVGFSLKCESGFFPLPESSKVNLHDEDYQSNLLLYRKIRTYAIGHGCSAEWKEYDGKVYCINTAIFPVYEVKPVVPAHFDDVSLDMYRMSEFGNEDETVSELSRLCDRYEDWIKRLQNESRSLDKKYSETAGRHIKNCFSCLERMRDGVDLLKKNQNVLKAFQYMNRAMLLQQLHYNLPLQEWAEVGNILALSEIAKIMPDIHNSDTWHGDKKRYGKWRPFQIAFILINLRSIADKNSNERKYVDLIWFPTGGGKTEAYLGLSAYTIFIRRLINKDDIGSVILMRYTLRLLTAQQYERASSMICACETIRKEKANELGDERITIGLWVGDNLTPNKMDNAVKDFEKLTQGKTEENPFIILKCPWCGARMGPVKMKNRQTIVKGYRKRISPKKEIVFQCHNEKCDFSVDDFRLPLMVVDDSIYNNPPTLLLGTVDKFAMLPFRPEAQTIFGYHRDRRVTPPELIIQDELHLISGPLGSMVGHYETMIHELCIDKRNGQKIFPKVIASTATISRAKDQCHSLYNCGKENVLQFPPVGLDAGDSFFAKEDKHAVGRIYVGILAPASSSFAMTNIRLYSSLLFAAKELTVADEKDRDPYWTNLGYFNSLRELGQTATWISADIEEYLHAMYKRRMKDKEPEYKQKRRYIYKYEELTSRIRSDEVPQSLQKLSIKYNPPYDNETFDKRPVDICLATNMISVGVDIPRLGLMSVTGQPKTTSEYIQSTSRVGRSNSAPGLIFVAYNHGKPRDKSHYEHFQSYHSKLYCHVEPTSVTPFAAPLRERALHAIIVGLTRLLGTPDTYDNPRAYPNAEIIDDIINIIKNRVESIDPDETENTLKHIHEVLTDWKNFWPHKYDDFSAGDILPLMYPAGTMPNPEWGGRAIPTPTSMRNVDASCEVTVLKRYIQEE